MKKHETSNAAQPTETIQLNWNHQWPLGITETVKHNQFIMKITNFHSKPSTPFSGSTDHLNPSDAICFLTFKQTTPHNEDARDQFAARLG